MEKIRLICGLLAIGVFLWVTPSTGQVTVNCPGDSLQTAINNNDPGTTFNVSGTCNENITIWEMRENVTINGGGTAAISGLSASSPVITIRGQGVVVTGFTISGGQDGIQLWRGGTGTIYNNTIQNTGRNGVTVSGNSFATIYNNTISNNPDIGICVLENSGARIGFYSYSNTSASPNTIQYNDSYGIEVFLSSRATIVGNNISYNNEAGILVTGGSQASISYNSIDDNGGSGIYVGYDSYVNLGGLTGLTIFDLPNSTTTNNEYNGLKCEMGAIVTGRIGTLNGNSGNIANSGIGIKTSELADDYGIDILTASTGSYAGLIRLGNGTANNTDKVARMVVRHYNNAEEPVYLFGAYSGSTDNFVAFGGGSLLGNAATQLDFFTAPDTITQAGFPRITIKGNGYVGIGTQSPSYPLQMASGAYVTTGGVWTNGSSREYKENIKALTKGEAFDTLKELNPVKFAYKVDSTEKHVGFISEEAPDLIATKDRKGLSPMDIVAVLTKVVQEQQNTISALSEKIAELERGLKLKEGLSQR
jgi:hypothetical protein